MADLSGFIFAAAHKLLIDRHGADSMNECTR